jgi:hypothetical protein
MDFVKISKIQPNRLVHDFKLNPSIIKKIGFDSEMENPHYLKVYCCVLRTLYELTPLTCSMGKDQNSELELLNATQD